MPKPGTLEWRKRKASLLATEMREPARLFWLSFADDDAGGFLGVVITEAHGPATAAGKCWGLGINPGGQMMAIEIPPDYSPQPPIEYRDRLLSKEQIAEFCGDAKSLGELEAEESNGKID